MHISVYLILKLDAEVKPIEINCKQRGHRLHIGDSQLVVMSCATT